MQRPLAMSVGLMGGQANQPAQLTWKVRWGPCKWFSNCRELLLKLPKIFWLVVWNIFYFPIYWVSNHPNWLSYIFRGVAQPPTSIVWMWCSSSSCCVCHFPVDVMFPSHDVPWSNCSVQRRTPFLNHRSHHRHDHRCYCCRDPISY